MIPRTYADVVKVPVSNWLAYAGSEGSGDAAELGYPTGMKVCTPKRCPRICAFTTVAESRRINLSPRSEGTAYVM